MIRNFFTSRLAMLWDTRGSSSSFQISSPLDSSKARIVPSIVLTIRIFLKEKKHGITHHNEIKNLFKKTLTCTKDANTVEFG